MINALKLILLVFLFATPAIAGNDLTFGGDLDRPISVNEADKNEGVGPGDEELPEEPDDEEPNEPPIFIDEEIPGNTIVLALDRSGSMSSSYSSGKPVYDINGNLIAYPSRWQVIQSETASMVSMLTEEQSFDLITYETQVYFCFGQLRKATPEAKVAAIGWIYSQGVAGCTNSYDALRAAFNNYGQVDTILFMSDGYPNTALSLGCNACGCGSWIGSRILSDINAWITRQIQMFQGFTFLVIQMGGSPIPFMTQLGGKPHSSYTLK